MESYPSKRFLIYSDMTSGVKKKVIFNHLFPSYPLFGFLIRNSSHWIIPNSKRDS